VSVLKPKTFSFDGAHPALAEPGKHYLHAKQSAQMRRSQDAGVIPTTAGASAGTSAAGAGVGAAGYAVAAKLSASAAGAAAAGNSSARSFGSDYSSASMPGSSSFQPAGSVPAGSDPTRLSVEYVVGLVQFKTS
jgi:hypothetical protein